MDATSKMRGLKGIGLMYNMTTKGFYGCLLPLLFLLPACYSSTAVMGTPVDKVSVANKSLQAKKVVASDEDKRQILLMSQTKDNKTFVETANVPEYRIGPQDTLSIISHVGEKLETVDVTVDDLGRISYSFLDDLDIYGKTADQVDELLTEKLSSYLLNPRIDILVKKFSSKTATVLGEVGANRSSTTAQVQSSRVTLNGKTTIMDLIAKAGGYTIDADIGNVKFIRQGKSYLLNLYDILQKGDTSQNVIIDDGDVVDIPELPAVRERIFVMGAVNAQGAYTLSDAKDLLGAIALAGNVTITAKEENTLIIRGYAVEGKKTQVLMANVKAMFRNADMSQDIALEEGDLVYVPEMAIKDVNEWITNTLPLLDFLFYPKTFQDNYFNKDFLNIDGN
jgi:protein involved in polysaccharide export with SLBB domain